MVIGGEHLEIADKTEVQYVEEFKVLLLDRGNRVLGIHNVSQGGQAGCVVDPKIIFGAALKANAAAILGFHYVEWTLM